MNLPHVASVNNTISQVHSFPAEQSDRKTQWIINKLVNMAQVFYGQQRGALSSEMNGFAKHVGPKGTVFNVTQPDVFLTWLSYHRSVIHANMLQIRSWAECQF